MPKNQDYSPPNIVSLAYQPVSFKQFIGKEFPVYWLPGQTLNETSNEYEFQEDQIPNAPIMHIPKVGRFLYSYGEGDDIAALWCGKKARDCEGDPGGGSTNYCNQCVEVQHGAFIPGTGLRNEGEIQGWVGPIFSLPGFTGRNYCRIPAPPGYETDISICSLLFVVRDSDANIIWSGPISTYNPGSNIYLPGIYGAACCYPSPPVPPPPPPGGGGCGTPS